MSDALKHKDVGPELTYDEYHSDTSHTIDGADAGTVIANKVDKVAGKGLSTEDYTTAEKTKLSGIAEGAEVNVNADWSATEGDAQILNKPTIPDELADLSDDATHRLVTDTEKSTWNGKTDLTTVKADVDVASAISLKHTQGTDQGLDTGGANAVTAAQAKAGYTHSGVAHAPSDAVSLTTVKADADVASAISLKHASGSDNQDLSGLVPYSGATGDVNLGTHSLSCAGVSATGNVAGKTLVGDDLILWDTAEESPGDPSISMVSGDVANSLTLSTDGTVAEIVSNNKMFHFRTGENIIRFIKSLYEYWFTIDLTGANPQLTSYTGEIGFDNENLTTTGNVTAATLKATNLSDGKIPYHVSDTDGLADGPTKTDVDDAVSKKHAVGDSIASSISDGDTTHSPDGNSVFDALALKLNITSLHIPCHLSDSTAKSMALTADQKIPAHISDGTETNIPLTT